MVARAAPRAAVPSAGWSEKEVFGAPTVVRQDTLELVALLRSENGGDLLVGAVHDRHHPRVKVATQSHRFIVAALQDCIDLPLLFGG